MDTTITQDQIEKGNAIMRGGAGFEANRSQPAPRVDPSTIGKPDTGVYKAENGNYYNSDGTQSISSPEQDRDRVAATAEKYRSDAQQMTDLINSKYAAKTASDKDLIAATDAKARVLNGRAGVTDSATGASAVLNVQNKGNKVLAADDASRVAEISAALGRVSSMQSNEQKANEASARNDLVTSQNLRSKNKADGLSTIKALGQSGVDLEKFKTNEPDAYQLLLKSTGLSPLEFEANFNNGKGIKYQSKIQGNTFISYGTDPTTGKPILHSEVIPGLSADTYEPTPHYTEGGKMFFVPKNWNGDTSKILWQNGSPVSHATSKSSQTTQAKNEENDALNWLALQPGYDPKVDLEIFKNDPVKHAWAIQQAKLAKKSKGSTSSASGGA